MTGVNVQQEETTEFDTEQTMVATVRLRRLVQAVSAASEGAYDQASFLLQTDQQDSFGAIERAMRSFIVELRMAIEQNEQTIQDLRASKIEMQRLIESQKATIRELSMPIIDVWDRVLAVPLLGLIDSARAQDIGSRLLARVIQSRALWVLIDLTGVETIDMTTADHIVKLAGAVSLLGARCMLTGVGPAVAQALVSLGIELGHLNPVATLRDGLKLCLKGHGRRRDGSR